MMAARLRSIARHVALAASLGLILVTGDILLRQASQYRLAQQARKDGKFVPALTAYGSAIRMYVPGSPLTERSARTIWALAEERQAGGDPEGALLAYRELRSAFYAIHSIISPGKAWIARCDERIAALLSPNGTTSPLTGPDPDGKGAGENIP
jgi:hypothetical protein